MHDFEEAEQVQHHLERLISRELACLLPRQSGQREDRYMHLLGDPADLQAASAARANEPQRATAGGQQDERLDALEARIAVLEERLAQLESLTQ